MFLRVKLLIRLKFMKIKMNRLHKFWIASRNREADLHCKYKLACTKYYYANENTNPERKWEMRGEREFNRGKL